MAAKPKPADTPKPVNSGHGNGNGHGYSSTRSAPATPADSAYAGADLCPECHTISLVRAEGCRKCLTCGYSEC